ncbi:MAG: hypothetical protein KDD62_14300, partial [Bdellovibrionales bacterium]|nr:hypothetical protein [Bdellovibrionales bacterium]
MLFSRVSQALCSIVCLVVFSFSSPASARADQVQIISTNANDFDVHSAYSKIAAIGNGQFISTWIESQGNQFSPGSPLYFSSYIPTQGWSRPTVVVKSESPTDPINISYLQAFGDSDVAFIFWYQSGNRQQTGTYYAVISNGVIEEIKFLDQDLSTRDLSVAFDKKGHGVLVYTKTRVVTISEEGSERQETQAQQYVSYIENHRIAEPQVLTPWGRPKGPMIFSAAELNQSQKRLTAVWLEVGPSSYPGNFSNRTLKKFVILARTYDSTQGWSDTSEVAVEEESDPFGPPQSITNLKVSSAPNGQAMVSYFKLMPEGPQATPYRPVPVVSHRTTYGTWSTPTQVPELLESVNVASTSYPKDLQIAISSNGKQIIVWNNVCDERGVLREQ